MEKPSVNTVSILPSSKTILRGVQAFIAFSALGTVVGLWWKRPAGLDTVLVQLNWTFILALIPLLALDYWLGGLRYRLFLNGNHFPNVSLWDCMRSNWANMFMGAATPFQTGGAPAQLYMLWRKGVRVADSLLISTVNLGATLIFFLLSSLLALFWIPADLFEDNFTSVFRTSFVVVGSIAGGILLVLFFPHGAYRLMEAVLNSIPLRSERWLHLRERWLTWAKSETDRFFEGFRVLLRYNKPALVLTVIATLVLFFNKYLMGYAIARAIGQEVPFEIFIGLQVIQLLLIYFAPTPGASGVAELSAVWLMGKLMPESILLVYAVLWRSITTILAAVIGGVVLLREVNSIESEISVEKAV